MCNYVVCACVCVCCTLPHWTKKKLDSKLINLSCVSTETICYCYLQQAHSGADSVTHWVSAFALTYTLCVVWDKLHWSGTLWSHCLSLGFVVGSTFVNIFFRCVLSADWDPVWRSAFSVGVNVHAFSNFFPHTKAHAIHPCSIGGQACEVPFKHVDLTHPAHLRLRELPQWDKKHNHKLKKFLWLTLVH